MADRSSIWLGRSVLPSALLLLLAEGPMHGYALEDRLDTLGQFTLPAGSVYRALRRLEATGAVVSEWDMAEDGRTPRRTYRITPAGCERLAAAITDMDGFVDRLNRLLDDFVERS